MIEVIDLVKTYPGASSPAVDGVSFTVQQGGFYTLLGPSGCGKTTTLRCIAGLERPDSGTIKLGQTVVVSDRIFIPTFRRDIGMVFQNYAVWPHMTVFENVAFPLRVATRKPSGTEIERRVLESLALVGLSGLEKRMATQLSGGQQQRLSVARALVREPDVLLLDEPLSNLDAKLRERMRSELLLIQRRVGITTLFVTHDQVEALSMSDQIAIMDQGKIVQEGSPRDIYQVPANEFVAGFIGSTNLFPGTIVTLESVTGEAVIETRAGRILARAEGVAPGDSVILAIRPEDVVLHRGDGGPSAPANLLGGVVEIGLFTGVSVEYHLMLSDQALQSRVSSRVDFGRGDHVWAELPPHSIRVFSLAGSRAAGAAGRTSGQPS